MIRVACVGAGYFSQFHYDSWKRLPQTQLVGACDQDVARAEATGATAYRDLGRMLTETRPDILDVIVPPVAHADCIAKALDQGVSTIICQKPFCASLEEAKTMVARAAAAGTELIVHENFRFQPWFRAIKSHIETGAIGNVLQLTFRLRPGDGQGPNAYLDRQPYFQKMERFLIHETGVHYIDTFQYLLGDIRQVFADLRKVNPVIAGEDAGYVIFEHSRGVRSVLDANRALDHRAENLRCTMGEALIEGNAGTLSLRGDGSLWRRRFSETDQACVLAANTAPNFGGDCVHHFQTHVVNGVLSGTKLETRASDYLRVIEIEDHIYRSNALGQKLEVR